MTEAEFWDELRLILPGAKIVRYHSSLNIDGEEWVLFDAEKRIVERVDLRAVTVVLVTAGFHGKEHESRVRDAIFTQFLAAARKHAGIKPVPPAPQTWWGKVKSWVRGDDQ